MGMYAQGWFPMHDSGNDGKGEVRWVQPHHRGIIPLDPAVFRVPRSLRQRVRGGGFVITCDKVFDRVIRECAAPAKGREETWLDPTIIGLFELLHRAGLAHSVEAWAPATRDAGTTRLELSHTLVGGLYGLCVGSVFCGESMFSRPALGGTDASKVCLVHLVEHLRARKFTLLDAQLTNTHLEQFGAFEMPRGEYLKHLDEASAARVTWGKFDPARAMERGAERSRKKK